MNECIYIFNKTKSILFKSYDINLYFVNGKHNGRDNLFLARLFQIKVYMFKGLTNLVRRSDISGRLSINVVKRNLLVMGKKLINIR